MEEKPLACRENLHGNSNVHNVPEEVLKGQEKKLLLSLGL